MTTHQVLVAAKAYLLNHGWKQHDYGEDGGPRCMAGAVASVRGVDIFDYTRHPAPVYEVLDAISFGKGGLGVGVPFWNDDEGRTFDEVIAAFDRAIIATAPPVDDKPIFEALENLPAGTQVDVLSELALMPSEALHA